jgi:tripartite-type tricarboxylate transporter receptor subunit TctC
VAGIVVDLWFGLLAPAGTPKDIVARYSEVVNEILATPSVREALARQGLVTRGGTPEQLAELIATDQARWSKILKDAGISATD